MKFVVSIFAVWKLWILLSFLLGLIFIPQGIHFLGGGLEHYERFPYFWAWANFDGEHYLTIAQKGYGNGEEAFFPLYPLAIKVLAWPARSDIYFLQAVGLLVSHASFLIGLWGLWKLVRLDYSKLISQLTLLLLLIFPTAYYFGSIYTESLFFALVVWSFYFARTNKWWLAGILGLLASGTRFIGIILFPILLFEWYISSQKGTARFFSVIFLFLTPLGLLVYMYYLNTLRSDAFAFLHSLSYFGEQRATEPVLLPQVFWRYIKMFADVSINSPNFFLILFEVLSAVWFLFLSIFAFKRIRLSYSMFLLLGYLVPTFSGSFSSLPRYVLVLFPGFILMAILIERIPSWARIGIFTSLFILLGIATVLFTRGYWIA